MWEKYLTQQLAALNDVKLHQSSASTASTASAASTDCVACVRLRPLRRLRRLRQLRQSTFGGKRLRSQRGRAYDFSGFLALARAIFSFSLTSFASKRH